MKRIAIVSIIICALVTLLCATACNKDNKVKLAPEMDTSQFVRLFAMR